MKIKKREKKKVLNKDNKERFEVPRKENEKCLLQFYYEKNIEYFIQKAKALNICGESQPTD